VGPGLPLRWRGAGTGPPPPEKHVRHRNIGGAGATVDRRETAQSISHNLAGRSTRMADSEPGADRRDAAATNRDDAADRRDTISDRRDATADQRDVEAARRGDYTQQMTEDLEDRLSELRQQLLDHLQRIENLTSKRADRADTTSSGGSRHQRRDATEHRRLIRSLRNRVTALIDDLHNEIRIIRSERRAADRDREAAARDRHAAADDRSHSAQDRTSSARDRSQDAIERQQVHPSDLPQWVPAPATRENLKDRAAKAMSDSEHHIEASRARLARSRLQSTPQTSANADAHSPASSDE
jgi:hypothetical protein